MLNLNFVGSVTQANRKSMWTWLKNLQRKDGSFGEMLTAQGEIYGSRDMRICLCAAAVRWMLRLDTDVGQTKEDDINVDALVKHIMNSEVGNMQLYFSRARWLLTSCRLTMEPLERHPNSSPTLATPIVPLQH